MRCHLNKIAFCQLEETGGLAPHMCLSRDGERTQAQEPILNPWMVNPQVHPLLFGDVCMCL